MKVDKVFINCFAYLERIYSFFGGPPPDFGQRLYLLLATQ